eukprot:CAMPEP_0114400952 /NCGR_PEP_ID=MMETSP0102-20121206/16841_1 /TAXON_ID=38822 ORGANISM="Pteridomonas danica, Strain PT" /NCGR_SAMPLE_ID=MMETSP0102 /ASSEMBLY_ACC=CAM_ASM_000212 /LENGTH=146 /DNA_ID=CAMNT_0001563703 /DNA_START=310 /DNA_END=747 /DNA_ORIENTATION=+
MKIKVLAIEQLGDEQMTSKLSMLAKSVASSHVVVYYYTSLCEGRLILHEKGIPALKLSDEITTLTLWRKQLIGLFKPITIGERGGVVVSLHSPHKLTKIHDSSLTYMNRFAQSKEVVFCISVPRNILWVLRMKELDRTSTSTPPTA